MSTQAYTCISCRVAFASPDLQRAHYKSDWHRYNLKRKVAEMPAVTAEEFKQRVLAQQAQTLEAQKDTTMMCKVCNKHFNTQNAHSNHLQSKKHKEVEAKLAKKQTSEVEKKNAKNREKGLQDDNTEMDNKAVEEAAGASGVSKDKNKAPVTIEDDDEDAEWEDMDEDEEEGLTSSQCLFCDRSSANTEKNLTHMTKIHSFFIPNVEYLADMEGLLKYLGEKVGCGFMCTWCNEKGKAFYSLEAVQGHMRDKGHCKLEYDGDAAYEYSEFYDFRSSYPDQENKKDGDDTTSPMEEDEQSEESFMNQGDGYEMVLPSGAKIGHRELHRYYKQNVPLERRLVKRNDGVIGRLMTQYKALGWTGATGVAAQKTIKDLRFIQKVRSRHQLKTQLKANKLQHHFRPQVVF